jgi:hypothetical protein
LIDAETQEFQLYNKLFLTNLRNCSTIHSLYQELEMFYIASFIVFALLFTIWTTNGWANTILKFALFGMTCWSAFEALKNFGYIVNV